MPCMLTNHREKYELEVTDFFSERMQYDVICKIIKDANLTKQDVKAKRIIARKQHIHFYLKGNNTIIS